jgi:RHS repeat-associated protein
MRYLLLFLLLAVQGSVFGYSSNNRAENHAQKVLTSQKSDLNACSYHIFRYYDSSAGTYISQDPIGLDGNNPNFYAYTYDSNCDVDIFGLNAAPETAAAWEHRFNNLPPNEKFNAAQGKLHKVANRNGWTQNSQLTRTNKRVVYQGPDKRLYAFDTQHGRFEYLDKKGTHLGEFDIDGNQTKPPDTSGKHNIKCG